MEEKNSFGLSSAALHILAMALMLCDHLWALLLPGEEWLTCVGRLAFPIFAFLAAEGYRRTGNLRRYLLRLLVWALISEVPFDLMYGGSVFYPYHQNVLWTFLIALSVIALIERGGRRFGAVAGAVLAVLLGLVGYLAGYAAMTDYYGVGVLTVLAFWVFHGRNWKSFAGQLVCMYLLNVRLLGGYYYEISLFGHTFELVQQGLAMLALLPIWLYRGRQGYHGKGFRFLRYGFYPAHILILWVIRELLLA